MWLRIPHQFTEQVSAPALTDSNSGSAPPSPVTAPSLWWNGKSSPALRWLRVPQKARSASMLNGTTLLPSTAARGVESFISSLRASLASLTPSPESAGEPPTPAGSGPISAGSSKKLSRSQSFSKTCPDSSETPIAMLLYREKWGNHVWTTNQTTLWGEWEPFSGIWPASASMRNGAVYLRPEWEPATNGSGFSFWRTPDSPKDGGVRNRQGSRFKERHQVTIAEQAEHWQTPKVARGGYTRDHGDRTLERHSLDGQARMWATPMSRDVRSGETIADYGNARPLNERQLPGKLRTG